MMTPPWVQASTGTARPAWSPADLPEGGWLGTLSSDECLVRVRFRWYPDAVPPHTRLRSHFSTPNDAAQRNLSGGHLARPAASWPTTHRKPTWAMPVSGL